MVPEPEIVPLEAMLMPGGSPLSAASMYFWTLSVENCGAIGMPIVCVTWAPARSSSAASDVGSFRSKT